MPNGTFFDQVSLAAIANLTAGMTSTRGTIIELITSFLIVRVALKIFYSANLTLNGELQLLIVSAVSWIVGNSLLRDHDWQTQDLYLEPEQYKELAPSSMSENGISIALRTCLDLLRKVV
jgi:hypothetical protein